MNSKLAVGGIFCDLEKAFDTVDHGILLSKFKFNCINGKQLALYQSYLDKIYSRMLIHNESDTPTGEYSGTFTFPHLYKTYLTLTNKTSLPVLFVDDSIYSQNPI
jgi:hypothetical protein